jgi:hypothetical protein
MTEIMETLSVLSLAGLRDWQYGQYGAEPEDEANHLRVILHHCR